MSIRRPKQKPSNTKTSSVDPAETQGPAEVPGKSSSEAETKAAFIAFELQCIHASSKSAREAMNELIIAARDTSDRAHRVSGDAIIPFVASQLNNLGSDKSITAESIRSLSDALRFQIEIQEAIDDAYFEAVSKEREILSRINHRKLEFIENLLQKK